MWNVVRGLQAVGRHDHPHDALHRGSRGDGRPHRRHQPRRDHPRRGEGRAHAQARQEADDAAAARAARRRCRRRSRSSRSSCTPTGTSSSTRTTRAASARASRRCSRRSADAGIRFKDLSTTQSSLEEIFVSLVRRQHELARRSRHLPLRDGAHVPHDRAEHRRAGALDVAVLRRVRLGDRLADPGGRRHELRRVHRAGPDHAVAADGEHRQRLVRHLFPALHGHDLRGAVGARLARPR